MINGVLVNDTVIVECLCCEHKVKINKKDIEPAHTAKCEKCLESGFLKLSRYIEISGGLPSNINHGDWRITP